MINNKEAMKMQHFVPYEKLSKKKQRELNAKKRGSWGGLNPVTRKSENPKAYNRKKAQRGMFDPDFEPFYVMIAGCCGFRCG